MGIRHKSGWVTFLIAALAVATMPSDAVAATVVNGGFESGTLSGWNVHRTTGAGNWFAYSGTDAPIGKKRKPKPADPVQAPPQGTYAATSDEANPDTLILYQDVVLEPGVGQRLSLLAYYDSYEPIAVPAPNTLSVDDAILGKQKNQQFRIDVMRPDAPLESLDPADILSTLLATKPGDPAALAPTRLSANLSAFAGQTVRLRIANAVHEEVFNAGVDAVALTTATAGRGTGGSARNGPELFSFGRIKVNRHNGIATLRVRVAGPGLLRAKGVPASAAKARSSRVARFRKPIEPVTVPIAAARRLTIHLRPTPRTRAILREGHRIRARVKLTFMPTGGSAETASVSVVFRLTA